jgi:hypothetical protein
MPETTDSGTGLTSKCSDTTEGNIQNTSVVETAKPSSQSERKTRSKPPVSGTSDFRERSKEPPPRFLFSELDQLTFKVDETRYKADDTEHTPMWIKFISDYADVPDSIDWDDLEERADFLNLLYVYCEEREIPFPLESKTEESLTGIINAR